MYAKTVTEGEKFKCAGSDFVMLLPRDETRCCEAVLERVPPGHQTPPNAHETFNQVYVVICGEGDFTVGDQTRHLRALSVVYIPRGTTHSVLNSGRAELQYLYITVWPEGIPAEESDGGWKQVYQRMIQEYADRGYPVDRGQV